MTTVNYRKLSVADGKLRYAHPSEITHTINVSVASAPKSAGPIALTNSKFDYVENYQATVTNGTDNAKEQISIRISTSGSTQNAASTKAAVAQAFANYMAMVEDKALEGYIPEVVPTAVVV